MRIFLLCLLALAVLSVALVLSNTGNPGVYALRLAGWMVAYDTVPTLVVIALFVGAAVAGVPLALSNWWLRRRVGKLERQLARQQALHSSPVGAEGEVEMR